MRDRLFLFTFQGVLFVDGACTQMEGDCFGRLSGVSGCNIGFVLWTQLQFNLVRHFHKAILAVAIDVLEWLPSSIILVILILMTKLIHLPWDDRLPTWLLGLLDTVSVFYLFLLLFQKLVQFRYFICFVNSLLVIPGESDWVLVQHDWVFFLATV